ncbi:hypothetical protein L227DRAFT_567951 [Lentinus tigrinus ALCF2SS1-6]|uniref:Uncharacterized protein n=1 Tax=Lentinus tigrinus ALCF2SS1-6 TaxID=1328759 RepID=A0A5C2RRH8_9APHY|nr:hypothetical protein L227DRAFT_567951 [Lentinus tigrinus ALCF2SS1-6]
MQILLKKSLEGLRRLTTERLTAVALDRLDSHNRRHRQIITRKVENYFTARQRTAYLQHQNSTLINEIAVQRQSVSDLKRRLSKDVTKFEKLRQSQIKESNDIKLAIMRANQRIQRRLRHQCRNRVLIYQERRGGVPSRRRPNDCYVLVPKRPQAVCARGAGLVE